MISFRLHITIAFCLIWSGISLQISAQSYYIAYDSLSKVIYDDIIDLKFKSAKIGLSQMEHSNPNNLARLHLENYMDFFLLFIHENENQFQQLQKNKEKRIKIINDRIDDNDPYKKFILAEIHLHWAVIRAKFNQIFRAGREIYSAYDLLKENATEHPDFIYNKKSLSIIHSLIETITIPGLIKRMFGIKGSIELGVSEITEVIEYSRSNPFIFEVEADAIYAFILFYQVNDKAKALSFIDTCGLDHNKSLLANFLKAKFAQRSGFNEDALAILEQRPQGDQYESFAYLDFLLGLGKLRKLDESAIQHFESFLFDFSGKHYIKEAYQKLAWCHLIFYDDIPKYKYFMSLVKEKGSKLIDDDKQAYKESMSLKVPDPTLLKARLLFDGGYYERANSLLTQKAYQYYSDPLVGLEYSYRMGRISQALKNYPEALKYFGSTINNGQLSNSYYACNAALQMGIIYEEQNENEKSKKYYENCLKINPEEYKTSLHQKAKSGLARLKK